MRQPPRSTLFTFTTFFLFFFNDTATTEIYTLSLHDALPICLVPRWMLHEGIYFFFEHASHGALPDRKSTRLNSSHQIISYAVFCLKKKIRGRGDVAPHELLRRNGDDLHARRPR